MPRLEYKIAAVKPRTVVDRVTRQAVEIPGRPERFRFFEAEQRGTTVFFASGESDGPVQQRTSEHTNEDEAYGTFAQALANKRKSGFKPAGAAREITGSLPARAGSALLIDEYFAQGDERFLSEVLCFDGAKKLSLLAEPWFKDTRAFARRALHAYVADGCDRPGHKALVKRLFKLAELAKDHELMAGFMVAFDRLTRRPLRIVSYQWDPATRQAQPVRALTKDPSRRERLAEGESDEQFTRATRRYLTRRAFRYFRRIGYANPTGYRTAVLLALQRYRDEHLGTVGRLLSAWGLLHVLYGRSPVLVRSHKGIYVAPGRTLAELSPMPIFPRAWDGAFEELSALLLCADSRTVRQWARSLLKERYASELERMDFVQIKALALSPHEEAQVLGVELFARVSDLERVALSDWLELLGAQNLEILALVCERAKGALSGAHLTLAQCVELALAPAAPLAALGFSWLKEKPVTTEAELTENLRLGAAKVAAVRADGAARNAELLRTLSFVTPLHVREQCDAAHVEVRGHALAVAAERFGNELTLWSALCESPYPDVKRFVVGHAQLLKQAKPETLAQVFGSMLLSLSGSSSDKPRIAREIARRVAQAPAEAEALLPLLRLTLRSIHPTERTLSLGALLRVSYAHESVRRLIQTRFPELSISGQASE